MHIRISKHYVHLPYFILGIVETLIFAGSLYLAAYFRFFSDLSLLENLGPLYPRAICFAAVMIISMISLDVYHAKLKEGMSGVMLRTAIGFFLGAITLSSIFYLFPSLHMGRGVAAVAALISFLFVILLRSVVFKKLNEEDLKRRILILGAGKRALELKKRLRRADRKGFIIVGFIPVEEEVLRVEDAEKLTVKDGLYQCALLSGAHEIVVAMDDRRRNFPMLDLLECKLSGIEVVDSFTFFERETGRVIVESTYPSWLVFSDGFGHSLFKTIFIRLFDTLLSAALVLITWPIMVIVAIAIKLEEGLSSQVIYRQKRVGLDGEVFWLYKFRSMREDAEKHGTQWTKVDDVRVTRTGQFIRFYRLDELPQLFNVLKGDMGLVGPRPEQPSFVDQLVKKIPYYKERHRIRPGITGWAQLRHSYGASEADAIYKLEYDIYYLKNQSLLLNVLILIQTVGVILFGKGAR